MTVIVPIDWTSIMTAIGTVAVAIVAVAVALFAEWRAGIRIRDEREHSATVLAAQQELHDKEIAEERTLAEQRLTRQLEHSAAQIAEERKAADERLKAQLEHSDAQLREERQRAQDSEQLGEAWSVEVLGARTDPETGITTEPGQPIARAMVLVTNHGRYTITRVEAQFSPEGQSLTGSSDNQPMPVNRVAHPCGGDIKGSIGDAYRGVLPPGGAMRFLGDTRLVRDLHSTYPIVRWTDHWNQRWEHKQGQVQRVNEGDPWKP
jgi:hypothetical protein